jgi:hypothetical protein
MVTTMPTMVPNDHASPPPNHQSRTAISRQQFTDYSWKIGVSFIYILYIIIF